MKMSERVTALREVEQHLDFLQSSHRANQGTNLIDPAVLLKLSNVINDMMEAEQRLALKALKAFHGTKRAK
jgi:hypothetical protein